MEPKGVPTSVPEVCGDGIDNDANGRTDCTDPACWPECSCLDNELCTNGADDDCDGLSDCDDPGCGSHGCCGPAGGKPEACTNGTDDDCDGDVDCADSDCAADTCCGIGEPNVEDCANDVDDDCDGKTDCHDADCSASPCACSTPMDCPVPSAIDFCLTRICENGVCALAALPDGTQIPLVDPSPGNCYTGTGCLLNADSAVPNDSDAPNDSNPSTKEYCFDGSIQGQQEDLGGDPCGDGLTCVKGVCSGCASAASCPPGDECRIPYCDAGKCAFYLQPVGQRSNGQVPHDCLARACKFNGNVELVADDADLPNDDNPCTLDLCTNGLASNQNAPAGTACGSGKTCDGNGACV